MCKISLKVGFKEYIVLTIKTYLSGQKHSVKVFPHYQDEQSERSRNISCSYPYGSNARGEKLSLRENLVMLPELKSPGSSHAV